MHASACGKVILLGEHAVVYGVPALCGALEGGASVEAVPGDGALRVPAWGLEVRPGTDVSLGQAYAAVLASLAASRGPALPPLQNDFVVSFTIPTGAGLGSSAALSVALIRAIDRALGLGLGAGEVDAAALAAERVFHGSPSGLDHTVAQHGGFGLFRRGQGLTPITGTPPLRLLIGHTGRARDTKARVARVAELYRELPESTGACFARIEQLVGQAVAALRRGDLNALGAAMNENQSVLEKIEVSCPEIEAMCQLALAAGAAGAKLTGGGGGGCVVALAPGREGEVAAAWQRAGFTSFAVHIGSDETAPPAPPV